MKKMIIKRNRILYHIVDGRKIEGKNPDMVGSVSLGLYGDCSWLSGCCIGLWGNCSRIMGNGFGLTGNFDLCNITEIDREQIIDIGTLIA